MQSIVVIVEEATNVMQINAILMANVNQFMIIWEFIVSSLKVFI
jgi:hypothetical protein